MKRMKTVLLLNQCKAVQGKSMSTDSKNMEQTPTLKRNRATAQNIKIIQVNRLICILYY